MPRGQGRQKRRMNDELTEICTIPIPSSQLDSTIDPATVAFQNVEAVASWSWIDTKQPTIVVPGSPNVWNDRQPPFTVPRDARDAYAGFAHARKIPFTSLEPLVAAVRHMHPDFPFAEIDIVCGRAFLRKLLRWLRGGTGVVDFRYDLQCAGRTVLCEHRTLGDWIAFGGHGRNFERGATRAQEETLPARLVEHDRVIRYSFGGLNLLVGYEVDACLPAEPAHPPAPSTSAELIAATEGERVKLVPGGAFVAQSRIVELKTRSNGRRTTQFMKETLPQLLFSQTPHLFVGMHAEGKFSEIRRHTLPALQVEAGWLAPELARLASALRAIYALVAEQHGTNGALLSIMCVGGVLKLFRRARGSPALPESMLGLFAQGDYACTDVHSPSVTQSSERFTLH